MGIIARITRIVKSNLNDLLERAENPEKMLGQCIAEMEDSLREAKMAVADALATEKKLGRQLLEAKEMAAKWDERARVAVSMGEDNLAREALRKKKLYLDLADELEVQLRRQREAVDSLKEAYAQLQQKLEEARARRRELLARRHRRVAAPPRAVATTPVLEPLFDTRPFDEFERIAGKVEDYEYLTEATLEMEPELSREPRRPGRTDEEVEIDLELAELKKQLKAKKAEASPAREVEPEAEAAPPPEEETPGSRREVEL